MQTERMTDAQLESAIRRLERRMEAARALSPQQEVRLANLMCESRRRYERTVRS